MIKLKVKVDKVTLMRETHLLTHFMATAFYNRLIENIKTNRFGFENSPETIARKGSDIPMIDTGAYLNSIQINGSKVEIIEGTTKSGISFEELANILEYGRRDKGFTGFPVWRKTLEEFKADIPQLIKLFQKLKHK